VSPDGASICWLSWNHPNMPWDGTELWTARIGDDGSASAAGMVAGGPTESIFQPEWSPDGRLFYVSDRDGWWKLYGEAGAVLDPSLTGGAEFGAPQWAFDSRTYAFLPDGRIACAFARSGRSYLAIADPETGGLTPLDLPLTGFGGPRAGTDGSLYFNGSSPTTPSAIYRLSLASGGLAILRRSSDLAIDAEYISIPEPLEFPTEGGLTAHALYYAPKNPNFTAPAGEKPPLIVMSHGGPTSASGAGLSLGRQYWTSRGFALLDVNYGGSTGYGREYRERLNGKWGIVDVDDCCNGARYLAQRGLVDPERMAITGGSAGGYTTLSALAFRDVFKAGASHFGIGDLEALARDTHKFESRYLDGLVGPYPERRDIYVERSPIHHVDRLGCPAIFFQGLEDRIVTPNQAEAMVAALKLKGIPVAYLAFEGEQHGFRKAENIKRALDGELYFYSRIFGFEPADSIEPVHIDNL
jgi:dipeptidyl aminopeptidase/acylaminoacyl peptidase